MSDPLDPGLPEQNPPPPPSAESPAETAPPEYRNFGFQFTGDTGEYFRIWIVNILLTLVTLGFYTPWARVRTRRYFHANTHLDGHAFDYLAKPINILWGYLIVLAVVVGYNAADFFNPLLTLPFLALYLLGGPWIVYKAMRFKAHNTSYRNVRFEFHGKLGDAYAIFLGMAFLVPFTFGLIVPFWIMKQKEYFYKNIRYGGRRFEFNPEAGEYYVRYLLAGLIGLGIGVVAMFLVGGAMAAQMADAQLDPENPPPEFFVVLFASYVPMMLGMVFVQMYVYVSLFNYNLSRLIVDKTTFDSTARVWGFYWLTVTNIFATVMSLGLLAPWAMIRKTRYLAERVQLIHPGAGLGEFAAAAGSEVSAIGDAAADVFEFDIGW